MIMDARDLKILAGVLFLVLVSQGCYFHARVGSLQGSPRSTDQIAANVDQGKTATGQSGD